MLQNSKTVLIFSPDVPFPDNYGGALDMWKRIVYLKGMGFTIHLISLYREDARLKEFEASVQFAMIDLHLPIKYSPHLSLRLLLYPAAMTIRSVSRRDVQTHRQTLLNIYDYGLVENSKTMLAFFDIQKHLRIQFGRLYVRMQNCEWEYYAYMAGAESSPLKKIFFNSEAAKFKLFEKKMVHDDRIDGLLFISERDRKFYGPENKKSAVLPVYMSPTEKEVNFATRKNLLLFIGNLELADNVSAVEKLYAYLKDWLAVNPDSKLVIAGKNKSGISPFSTFEVKNVEVMFNISHDLKSQLVEDAKVFCSFSMNPAGVKLKTLEGAAAGLPILANNNACDGSGLEPVVMNIETESKAEIYARLDAMMGDMATFVQMSISVSTAYRQLMNDAAAAHAEIFPC